MSHLDAKTVTLDDAAVAPVCDLPAMAGKRPRVVLSITPRLLQDTLSVALAQHADVVDVGEWRERRGFDGDPAFDLAVVSGGSLPQAIAAEVVIDVDGGDGVPSLDALCERLRAMNVAEQ